MLQNKRKVVNTTTDSMVQSRFKVIVINMQFDLNIFLFTHN